MTSLKGRRLNNNIIDALYQAVALRMKHTRVKIIDSFESCIEYTNAAGDVDRTSNDNYKQASTEERAREGI
jgi:hypothetical protein